ncbi:hypothetical protein [Actinoallomurus sp. CA-150999]|uniref:hypothetical protein n=1 Tax=Actinoallomurus sp. CA-150999 TaxID=3239887 RepID=UPI003D8CD067
MHHLTPHGHGDSPWIIGPIADVHGTARWIAGGVPIGPLDFAEGGRGLHIVRMLAADSGVSGDTTGRTVWFEVTF